MVSKAERAASAASRAAGRGVGTGIGAAFSSPAGFGLIAVIGIIAILFIFRDRISEAFSNFGKIEFPPFPEFPDINIDFPDFPELPNLCALFGIGCPEDEDPGDVPPPPPGPIDDPDFPLGDVETPEGCVRLEDGSLSCPSPPTFDVCTTFPELCEPCGPGETRIGGICQPVEVPEPGDPGFIGPVQPPEPFSLDDFLGITPPIEEPFEPPVELPPGFVGEGPSFEGGTIFETTDQSCTTLSCVIDRNPGFTASQAADRLAEILGTFGDFDFGTSTGSGFGPGDDPLTDPLVTGGATPESEARRAACTSCELFGLNCPICAGTI